MDMCREGVVEAEIGGALEVWHVLRGWVFRLLRSPHSMANVCIMLRDVGCWRVDISFSVMQGYRRVRVTALTTYLSGEWAIYRCLRRDIYNIVLAAHNHVTAIAHPGMMYAELQRECYRVIGDGLRIGFFARLR